MVAHGARHLHDNGHATVVNLNLTLAIAQKTDDAALPAVRTLSSPVIRRNAPCVSPTVADAAFAISHVCCNLMAVVG